MSRNKEIDLLVVDVGPHMHPHLDLISQALSNYALTKTLNKPSHEMAILLFGTTETKNSLFDELGEYANISVLEVLRTPNQETLRLLQDLPRGTGPSDFVDAMAVVMDMVIKAGQARVIEKVPKKLVLISNFGHTVKEADEEFLDQLTEGMKLNKVQLEVLCLKADEAQQSTRQDNLELLASIMAEAGDREIKFIQDAHDILGSFRTRDVSYQCVKFELEIGKTMAVRVRIYKKCGFEKLPTFKTKALDGEDLVNINISVEHFLDTSTAEADQGDQEDPTMAGNEPVPSFELAKAYRYGKQYIPMDQVNEMMYIPGKTLQLLGFVDRAPLLKEQRYLFLKDPQVVLPEQDESSQVALSALVQGMHQQGKAAVVRYARTAKSPVSVYALLPQLGSATLPDHLIMLGLPFSEDIRTYEFPPLVPKEELKPSSVQMEAARRLVKTMDLASGPDAQGREALKPEETANPTLRRFYRALAKLSLNRDQDFSGKEEELLGPASEDLLVQAVLETPWGYFNPEAKTAGMAFQDAFKTEQLEQKKPQATTQEGAGASNVVDNVIDLTDE